MDFVTLSLYNKPGFADAFAGNSLSNFKTLLSDSVKTCHCQQHYCSDSLPIFQRLFLSPVSFSWWNTNQPYKVSALTKCESSQGLQRQCGANSHGQTSLPGAKIKFSLPAAAVTRQQKSAVAGIVFRAQMLKALMFKLTPSLTPQSSPWYSKVVPLQFEHMRLKALKIYFHRITE